MSALRTDNNIDIDKANKQIEKLDENVCEQKWMSPPRIHVPSQQIPECNNTDFAKWLVSDVLGEPERVNSYMTARLIKDLNYGYTTQHIANMYFNEMSQLFSGQQQNRQFGRKEAYEHMVGLCERRNHWERKRHEQKTV